MVDTGAERCDRPAVITVDVDTEGNVILPVHAQPGARRTGVVGRHGDAVKLRVAPRAERGKANAAVCDLLAGELGVSRRQVDVVAGHASRSKRVVVRDVDAATVERWLAGLPDG
jgi:uncharacterized protein (TIGR00251 family)